MVDWKTDRQAAILVRRAAAPKRADFGTPIDSFFDKQPPELRAILDDLRSLIAEIAPAATASLKWGMPWFSVGGKRMCSLTAHKAHVNLVLVGPPDAFPDPGRLLRGGGKGGRHLQIRKIAELPRASVRTWLGIAAQTARSQAGD